MIVFGDFMGESKVHGRSEFTDELLITHNNRYFEDASTSAIATVQFSRVKEIVCSVVNSAFVTEVTRVSTNGDDLFTRQRVNP